MAQMYKVFIESRVLFLTKVSEKSLTKIKVTYSKEVKDSLVDIIFNTKEDVTIESDNLDLLWRDFKSHFKQINAAGGIVEKNQEFLFIKRNGKWDIPKGKLEKGENVKEGAIREIEEECNIHNPTILSKICNTYHYYNLKGQHILKKSSWFHLAYEGNDLLTPQLEEGITEVKWFPESEFKLIRENTYGSIIEVLDQFTKKTS